MIEGGDAECKGMAGESKRRELDEKCKSYSFVLVGVGKTHILGQGVWIKNGCEECKLWEDVEGGVVWTRTNKNFEERGKKDLKLTVCGRMLQCLDGMGQKWCGWEKNMEL